MGRGNTANKYHWHVWGVGCPCSRNVCFLSLHCSGFRLLCRERALGCMHFPGLSCSGSGSQVLHKGTDSVWPVVCTLSRSKQLRRPGAWRAHSFQVGRCVLSPPWSQPLGFLGAQWEHHLRWAVCLLWGADLWLQPSWWMSAVQDPRKSWLTTGNVFTVW